MTLTVLEMISNNFAKISFFNFVNEFLTKKSITKCVNLSHRLAIAFYIVDDSFKQVKQKLYRITYYSGTINKLISLDTLCFDLIVQMLAGSTYPTLPPQGEWPMFFINNSPTKPNFQQRKKLFEFISRIIYQLSHVDRFHIYNTIYFANVLFYRK